MSNPSQPIPEVEMPPAQALPIAVQQMSHQLDIWRSTEDWAGVMNTAERRKLQNRLNQRAYRRRKLLRKSGALVWHNESEDKATNILCKPETAEQQHQFDVVATKLNVVRQLSEQAYARYLGLDPQPETLLRVVQINVFNALAGNAEMLGLSTSWLLCDSLSPFAQPGPSSTVPSSWPINLRPTALQVSVPRHPWIDLLPWPRLRDTFLRLTESELVDEDDLCHDIVEIDTTVGCSDKANLIIWGDPWDPRGCEASSAFLRKWSWTLEGCADILEATNHWRQKRGERKIALFTQPATQKRQKEVHSGP